MITIYSNGLVSRNHVTLGHVRQAATETEFRFEGTQHYYPVGRIVLSKPEKAGWVELETAIERLAGNCGFNANQGGFSALNNIDMVRSELRAAWSKGWEESYAERDADGEFDGE